MNSFSVRFKLKLRLFNDFVRGLKYNFVKIIFDHKNTQIFSPEKIQKILFLRHDNKIGDSVVSSFLLREIKKKYPQLQVGVVVGENNQHLLRFFKSFDQVILTQKGIWPSIKTVFAMRRWRPDLVVDFSLTLKPKTLFFLTASRAPFVCSYTFKELSARNVPLKVDARRWHIADQLAEFLKVLGISTPDLSYEILLPEEARQSALRWQQEQGLHDFICVNLKAASNMRSLRSPVAEKIISLLRKVRPQKDILLLGLSEELPLLQEIQRQVPRVFIAAGKSLAEQMALVFQSSGVLTPDTAWTHIASAFSLPIVGVFRIDDESVLERTSDIWAPRSPKSERVYARGVAPDKPEPDASSVDLEELGAAMERIF